MNSPLALFNLGGGEIILILALILLLLGARKLPDMTKGLGNGINEWKKATREVTDEINASTDRNDDDRTHLIIHGITALLLILLGIAILSFLSAIL